MAEVTLKGNKINTIGDIPSIGDNLGKLSFKLTKTDLSDVDLNDFKDQRIVLNIFLSLDTATCANSVRRFNQEAGDLVNTVVLCISKDLPFANNRFCTAEGIENVVTLSEMRNSQFSENIGLKLINGPLAGLMARAVIVLDEELNVLHSQLVQEVTEEPDYEAALKVLK
jgi:thioredoxin-dependent peroxiredoxin